MYSTTFQGRLLYFLLCFLFTLQITFDFIHFLFKKNYVVVHMCLTAVLRVLIPQCNKYYVCRINLKVTVTKVRKHNKCSWVKSGRATGRLRLSQDKSRTSAGTQIIRRPLDRSLWRKGRRTIQTDAELPSVWWLQKHAETRNEHKLPNDQIKLDTK